jgi:hypothetical protein
VSRSSYEYGGAKTWIVIFKSDASLSVKYVSHCPVAENKEDTCDY